MALGAFRYLGIPRRAAYDTAMPLHDLRCSSCGSTREVYAPLHEPPAPEPCPCGGILRRVFHAPAVVHGPVTETHFNRAVGKVVRSTREFRSELSRKSDEMSERLGYEQRYVPVDYRDAEPPGAREQLRRRQVDREGADPKLVFH